VFLRSEYGVKMYRRVRASYPTRRRYIILPN